MPTQAAQIVAHRLAQALMRLLEAVAPHFLRQPPARLASNLPSDIAHSLFHRLQSLILRCIRLSIPHTTPKPALPAVKLPSAIPGIPADDRLPPLAPLPKQPGWLLAALPADAPAIAAELAAILDDPAAAALFAAAPGLLDELRPILRLLGLEPTRAPKPQPLPPTAPDQPAQTLTRRPSPVFTTP